MPVYAYRGENKEKATIVDVFKNGARVKWGG
jgi:sRNA-binding protein